MTVPPESGSDEFDLFPDPEERQAEPIRDRNPEEEASGEEPEYIIAARDNIIWRPHRDTTLGALEADPHDENELKAAPAQICARCGRPIQPGDEVRRRADGTWVHEVCPPPLA
jgi:hypothetical protein